MEGLIVIIVAVAFIVYLFNIAIKKNDANREQLLADAIQSDSNWAPEYLKINRPDSDYRIIFKNEDSAIESAIYSGSTDLEAVFKFNREMHIPVMKIVEVNQL